MLSEDEPGHNRQIMEEQLKMNDRQYRSALGVYVVMALLLDTISGCRSREMAMDTAELRDFGARYTAAWCSQNASSVAEFFAEDGSLKINDGSPYVGRTAITSAAQDFMTALPDMVLTMDGVSVQGDQVVYRWTLNGTNTGLVVRAMQCGLVGMKNGTLARPA